MISKNNCSMQRRSLIRMLAISGVVSTGIGRKITDTDLVQPVQAQPENNWNQATKLAANDGDSQDIFGRSVALSSDATTAVIGAPGDEEQFSRDDQGSAYVFERTDDSWSQETKLTVDTVDGNGQDRFGKSVAVSGDGRTAVIGAPFDDVDRQVSVGSAYVFAKTDDSWIQQARLNADELNMKEQLGTSVIISGEGTTAVIGAVGDDNNTGSTYVFNRTDGSWSQQAKLTAADRMPGDTFGRSVALSSDATTAVIGAPGDNGPNDGKSAGAAYVFNQTDGSWSQETKLLASDRNSGDVFGRFTSLSNDGATTVVSADFDDNQNGENAGAAYVFTQTNDSWNQETKLVPTDGNSGDNFGLVELSSDGKVLLVGALNHKNGAGSAYIFNQTDGSWSQESKLSAADGDGGNKFGGWVSLSDNGTDALIGAPFDDDPNGEKSGSVYVFSSLDTSESVEITEPLIEPSNVDGTNETHTLTFDVQNLSADGGQDDFTVEMPQSVEIVDVTDVAVVNGDYDVTYSNNESVIEFTVDPDRDVDNVDLAFKVDMTLIGNDTATNG